jgi:hypothetical protein
LPTYNTASDTGLGPLGFKATIVWMYHPADRIAEARAFYAGGLTLPEVRPALWLYLSRSSFCRPLCFM